MTITISNEQALDALLRLTEINSEDYEGTELAQMQALVDQLRTALVDDSLIEVAVELIVGPEKPPAGVKHRHGTYTDTFYASLTGKTALVYEMVDTGGLGGGRKYTIAQFDDHACGYAYGWHRFGPDDFKLDELTDE